MAITQTGATSVANTGQTTITYTPGALGDLAVLSASILVGSTSVTSVSDTAGNVWSKVVDLSLAVNQSIWVAPIAAGVGSSQTITIVPSASVASTFVELTVDELTVGTAATWAAVASGQDNNGLSTTTVPWSSLMSDSSSAPQAYWGYAYLGGSGTTSGTAGFTFTVLPVYDNLSVFGDVASSTTAAPVGTQSPAGTSFSIGMIIQATPDTAFFGVLAGVSALTGVLGGPLALAGSIAGQSAFTGILGPAILTGTLTAMSALTGILGPAILGGAIVGKSSTTGTLGFGAILTGTITGAGSLSGFLGTFDGTITATMSLTGMISAPGSAGSGTIAAKSVFTAFLGGYSNIEFLPLVGALQYLVAFNNNATDDFTTFTVATPPGTLGSAGQWTDITPYVYAHQIGNRGRTHDTAAFEAGQIAVDVDDTTGAFTPWNTSGPYFGSADANGNSSLLTVRRPFQVRCNVGGNTYYRFTGHVAVYDPVWADPFTVWCQIQAYDALRLFNNTNMVNYYSDIVVADSPLAYYRVDDTTGTTALATVGTNAEYFGDFTLGATGAINGDPDTAVTLGDTGSPGFLSLTTQNGVSGNGYSIEVWVNPGSSGASTTGTAYYQYTGTPTSQTSFAWLNMSVGVSPSECWLSGNGTTVTSVQGGTLPAGDGWHHIVITVDVTGNHGKFFIDGVDTTSGTPAHPMPALTGAPGPSFGANSTGHNPITNTTDTNPSWIGGLDEPALYDTVLTPTQIAAHYAAGRLLEAQELSGTQLALVLANVNWPTGAQNLDTGVSTVQGTTGSYLSTTYGTAVDLSQTSALSLMQGIEETEAGALFAQANGVLRFVARNNLYSASPWTTSQATLGDNPASEIGYLEGPQLPTDDTDLYTQATIQPQDLSLVSFTAPSAVTKQFGTVTWQPNNTLLQTNLAEASAYCEWVVNTHYPPLTRIDSITIDTLDVLALDGGVPGTHTTAVLSLDLMQRVTVKRHHLPGGTAFSQVFVIEQISESVSLGTAGTAGWTITFALTAPLAAPTF